MPIYSHCTVPFSALQSNYGRKKLKENSIAVQRQEATFFFDYRSRNSLNSVTILLGAKRQDDRVMCNVTGAHLLHQDVTLSHVPPESW